MNKKTVLLLLTCSIINYSFAGWPFSFKSKKKQESTVTSQDSSSSSSKTEDEILIDSLKHDAKKGDLSALDRLVHKLLGYEGHIPGIEGTVFIKKHKDAIEYAYKYALGKDGVVNFEGICLLTSLLNGPINHDLNSIIIYLEKNEKKADEEFDPTACGCLSKLYLHGIGVDKDLNKAFNYAQKAAAKGDINGKKVLLSLYFDGKIVERDLDKAEKLTKEIIEQEGKASWSCAMLWKIAQLRYNIIKNPKDIRMSVVNTIDAAELGDSESQFFLGMFYKTGSFENVTEVKDLHLKQDLKEAKKWFTLSAEQGDEGAIEELKKL